MTVNNEKELQTLYNLRLILKEKGTFALTGNEALGFAANLFAFTQMLEQAEATLQRQQQEAKLRQAAVNAPTPPIKPVEPSPAEPAQTEPVKRKKKKKEENNGDQ